MKRNYKTGRNMGEFIYNQKQKFFLIMNQNPDAIRKYIDKLNHKK